MKTEEPKTTDTIVVPTESTVIEPSVAGDKSGNNTTVVNTEVPQRVDL
jgi:hypothetical protein